MSILPADMGKNVMDLSALSQDPLINHHFLHVLEATKWRTTGNYTSLSDPTLPILTKKDLRVGLMPEFVFGHNLEVSPATRILPSKHRRQSGPERKG